MRKCQLYKYFQRDSFNDLVMVNVLRNVPILRDKMNFTVGSVSSPSLPCQHGKRQQGWYNSGTLRKLFPNLTVQFILSLCNNIHSTN